MSESELVEEVGRYTCFCSRGVITPEEMTNKLFDTFAANPVERFSADLPARVMTLIPDAVLPVLREHVDAALETGFVRPAWHYGGGRPQTEEEKRIESLLLTSRIREWSKRLRSTH
jgi:hypothetical protein